MKEKLYELLKENKKEIDFEKVDIIFNKYSIDLTEIDPKDGRLYGEIYYSVYDAYDRLLQFNALIDVE